MFEQRTQEPQPAQGADIPFVDDQLAKTDPEDEKKRRHAVLMECLADERERQAEERVQAAIDEDFYDHLQWRREDATLLIERGQAPLVFNEARQTIDWISGTEKRMRKDYKILGREQSDEKGADTITQVVKYTDEANLTQWHRSRVFKQAAISGLGWLEEGINTEPGEEIILSGSEDWRNVFRDSRSKAFDLKDARYLFRRKCTDLDYAMALLPKAKESLRGNATSTEHDDDPDGAWYLGERLTGASDLDITGEGLPTSWRDRRAFIGSDYVDKGRRQTVELLECWYRVPETVKVFSSGPLQGKVFNPAVPGHVQLQTDRTPMYDAVKQRMRVMVATKAEALWDGPSPFEHGMFLLVPVWGYRRYRDGMSYGAMRGMRDLQEDTNKRASKAIWLLSNNRIVMDEGAVDDVDLLRDEASRADGIIEKRVGKQLTFEKPTAEIAGNLEMMTRNIQTMRDIGGVTNANLGRGASGQSGISIERQQDQGSLTTSELFDNLLLATKLAGRLRLSHIKQFKTAPGVMRITGDAAPINWMPINQPDPVTGEMMNDIASITCDFIVAEQDYRESYVRAATAEMFELLGQIATYAPQVVMAVLDLAVDGSEIRNKEEWVARIRKLNGQRDPTKQPTPEEQQAAQQQQAEAEQAKQMQQAMLAAQLAELHKKIDKLDVEAMEKRVAAVFAALQAAQIVATTPGVAPVADVIAQGAGFQDQHGQNPDLPQPAQPMPGAVAPQGAAVDAAQPQPGADADPQPPTDPGPQQFAGLNDGMQTPTAADNGPAA